MYDKTAWPSMTSSLSLMVLITARKAVLTKQIAVVQPLDPQARRATAEKARSLICALLSHVKNRSRMAFDSQNTACLQYRMMDLSLIVQYAGCWRWRRPKHALQRPMYSRSYNLWRIQSKRLVGCPVFCLQKLKSRVILSFSNQRCR